MAYKSLEEFVLSLEKKGELIRIKEYVSTNQEMTEIVDRVSKSKGGGKAVLFENNGTDFPVLMNGLGSLKRISQALNVEHLDEIGDEIEGIFHGITGSGGIWEKIKMLPRLKSLTTFMPKKKNGKAACQEIVMPTPDLSKLPVLTCWPYDGGKFITLPAVHTIDPESGNRNIGMYRMQVLDEKTTGMHWHLHKTGANHFKKYKARGEKMPVAVTLGGDPSFIYAATAPMPENMDEYMLAGFLRKKRVEMVRCLTQDIMVPANVDFVIEGYVDPEDDWVWEGPFGDHTGFYSLADFYPRFHITCISHRNNAIYPATVVGIPPMEDAWIGKATERIFLKPIQLTMLPEMVDMNLPFAGVAHNITIFSIDKQYEGQVHKAFQTLWGAGQMMFNKTLVAVDADVNVHNYSEVVNAVNANAGAGDWFFSFGPADVLDHAAQKFGVGTKLGIDATRKDDINQHVKNQKLGAIGVEKLADRLKFRYNDAWLKENIGLLILQIPDNIHSPMSWFNKYLKDDLKGIKMVVLVDSDVVLYDYNLLTWYVSGNIDPGRDIQLLENYQENRVQIVIDGSRKYNQEGFVRQWPNVTISTDAVIKKIDSIWNSLSIGPFIESPSLKVNKLVPSEGAVLPPKGND